MFWGQRMKISIRATFGVFILRTHIYIKLFKIMLHLLFSIDTTEIYFLFFGYSPLRSTKQVCLPRAGLACGTAFQMWPLGGKCTGYIGVRPVAKAKWCICKGVYVAHTGNIMYRSHLQHTVYTASQYFILHLKRLNRHFSNRTGQKYVNNCMSHNMMMMISTVFNYLL